MSKELTCKQCKHFVDMYPTKDLCCLTATPCPESICECFKDKDGSRTRFCRLASSVDEMADALVIPMSDDNLLWHFVFGPLDYCERSKAIAAAKAWLMEVEE